MIILFIVIIILIIYIIYLKRNIYNINEELKTILESDTNKLIRISSIDKDILNIVKLLNNNLIILRKEKLKYKKNNKNIQESITNISHDIRTPMTSIKGYLSLIDSNTLSSKNKSYLNIIKNNINDCMYLIDNLFNYNVILDKDIKKEYININTLLEDILVNYYDLFILKNIKVNIDITNKKIIKYIDKIIFKRALDNIIINAYKYSKSIFNVSLDDLGILTLSNDTSLDNIDINKIYNRYYTVNNASSYHGLGLSIARKLFSLNKEKVVIRKDKDMLIIKIYL